MCSLTTRSKRFVHQRAQRIASTSDCLILKETSHGRSIVIVSAARTPIGGLLGDFSSLAAHELGGVAIKAAVERAGIPGDAVDEVLMGNCLMAGQGQAPARQAALGAGLPQSAGAVTLSKMCGSGMRAMMFAHDMLAAGSAESMVAGGMESMTNAPHLTVRAQGRHATAPRRSTTTWCSTAWRTPTSAARAMGTFAEECVAKYKFTREAQDEFAIASTERSKKANEDGSFAWEIAPVTRRRQGRRDRDQATTSSRSRPSSTRSRASSPRSRRTARSPPPTSSSISDGAAALVLMRESTAAQLGVKPIARIVAPRHARAGAELVHDRAGRRDQEGAGEDRLERQATSTCGRSTRRSPR